MLSEMSLLLLFAPCLGSSSSRILSHIQQLRVACAGGLFIRKSCNGPYQVRQLTSVKSLHALFARPPKDLRHQINNHGAQRITQICHGPRNGAKISARKVIRKQLGAG